MIRYFQSGYRFMAREGVEAAGAERGSRERAVAQEARVVDAIVTAP